MIRRISATLLMACAFALPAAAQQQPADTTQAVRTQALSILPIHAMIGFYAGEYERTVGPTATLGIGASHFDLSSTAFTYGTAEAKLRYYPSGDPLRGLSFGVTAGPTFISSGEDNRWTALGIGVEIARSQILGADSRFYYGFGGGAKRLFFVDEPGVDLMLPTLRLSVGYAF